MNNKLNNHDGKDMEKQLPENNKKANDINQVNRIKKKNLEIIKDTRPTESKEIPLKSNKKINSPEKTTHKGHVIKLENKENKTPLTKPLMSKEVNSVKNTIPLTENINKSIEDRVGGEKASDYQQNRNTGKDSYKLSASAGKWLLVVAAILFIAWAVIFFYYHIGGNSHMLLALAVICAVISLAGRKKSN